MINNSVEYPAVSIVVIGHNESKNLEKSLKAIKNMSYPQEKLEIIYVDSKSTDDSIEIARRYADKVFSERSNWPTAGEAFNRGILEASYDFVHISAGDIILDPDYLSIAIRTLLERSDIVAVTGYFEEINNTGWNKVIGYRRLDDTDTTDHYVPTPNGGTFKKSAFFEVNGYDERIKKGQETELGFRLKDKGFRILYKHIRQGIHDFDMNSTAQLIQRFINDGKSSAYSMLIALYEPQNKTIKYFFKAAIKRLVTFSSLILLALFLFVIELWLPALLVIPAYIMYLILMVNFRYRKAPSQYRLFRITMQIGSLFSYFGMLSLLVWYLFNLMTGHQLITKRKGLGLGN